MPDLDSLLGGITRARALPTDLLTVARPLMDHERGFSKAIDIGAKDMYKAGASCEQCLTTAVGETCKGCGVKSVRASETFAKGDPAYNAHHDEFLRMAQENKAHYESAGKKHGEGSRGGHVIGHTKSGKPVYAASHAAYDPKAGGGPGSHHFAGYSRQDHEDARERHSFLADQAHHLARTAEDYLPMVEHLRAANTHAAAILKPQASGGVHYPVPKPGMWQDRLGGNGRSKEHVTSHGTYTRTQHGSGPGHYVTYTPKGTDNTEVISGLSHDADEQHAAVSRHHQQKMESSDAPLSKSVCQAALELQAACDQLCKSVDGEGSRGGKVIGHTKSGKPVYATKSSGKRGEKTELQETEHYTAQDHRDASDVHAAAGRVASQADINNSWKPDSIAAHHNRAVLQHNALAKVKPNPDKSKPLHESIHEHLQAHGKTGLTDLHQKFAPGVKYDPYNPTNHPVNQALLKLREEGKVQATDHQWGQPSFSAVSK